jgi:hypothetical protein
MLDPSKERQLVEVKIEQVNKNKSQDFAPQKPQ